MQAMGGFRTLFAHLAGRRGAFEWTPEAERMRSALEMHELGVQLYRQRMRREYPEASRAEIDGLVRGWLTAPPLDGWLRLPADHWHFPGSGPGQHYPSQREFSPSPRGGGIASPRRTSPSNWRR